jgi:hypothetical protein
MPDNPYGPQQFTGPFAQAIQPQIVQSPHESTTPFSGYQGKGGATLGILSKFLEGVGKGRAQKAMATEMQKYQFTQGFSNWVNAQMSNPEVPPELKSQLERDAAKAMISEAQDATKDGAKQNPILGTLNKVFSGLAGGEVSKSKSDIGAMQKVMADWGAKLSLPQNTIQGQRTQLVGQAQKAVADAEDAAKQAGQPFTKEDAAKAVQPFIPAFDRFGGGKESISQILSPYDTKPKPRQPTEAEQKKIDADKRLAEFHNRTAGGAPPPVRSDQSAPTAAQGAPPLPVEAGSAAPPPTKEPALPAVRTQRLADEERDWLNTNNLVTEPKEMMVDGKPRQLQYSMGGPGIPAGFVDAQTGQFLPPSEQPSVYRKPDKAPYATRVVQDPDSPGKNVIEERSPEGKWRVAKDDNGKPLRQWKDQTNTFQANFNYARKAAIAEQADTSRRLEALYKERESKIDALRKDPTILDTTKNPPVKRQLTSEEFNNRQNQIQREIEERANLIKQDARGRINAIGAAFGTAGLAFLNKDESDSIKDDADHADAPIPEDEIDSTLPWLKKRP